jgi:hypothetical protein
MEFPLNYSKRMRLLLSVSTKMGKDTDLSELYAIVETIGILFTIKAKRTDTKHTIVQMER